MRCALSVAIERRPLGQDMNGTKDQVLQVSGLEFGYDKPLLASLTLKFTAESLLSLARPVAAKLRYSISSRGC